MKKRYIFWFGLILGCAGLSACASTGRFTLKKVPASPSVKEFPNADKVILLKRTVFRVESGGMNWLEEGQVQTKALNEAGAKSLARGGVVHSAGEPLVSVHARLVRPNGWVTTAKMSRDMYMGRYSPKFIDDNIIRMWGLSNSVPGAVQEYMYVRKRYLSPKQYFFQSTAPILKSELVVSAPSGFRFSKKVYGGAGYAASKIRYSSKSDPDDSSRTLHIWTAKNLPALKSERGMQNRQLRLARVQLVPHTFYLKGVKGDGTTWNGVAAFYSKLVGKRSRVTKRIKALADKLTKGASSKEDKIRRIYKFVRDDIRYIAVSVGLGGWQTQAADLSAHYRYGDCKAKSTLLIALGKAIGVKILPVLVRTRHLGPADKGVPTPFAFNHAINYIPSFKGGLYVDATSNQNELEQLRADDQGASALLINGNNGRFVTLPSFKAEENTVKTKIVLNVAKNHKDVTGTYSVEWGGMHRLRIARRLKKAGKRRKGVMKKMSKRGPLASKLFKKGSRAVQDVKFSNTGKTTKLTVKFSAILALKGKGVVYFQPGLSGTQRLGSHRMKRSHHGLKRGLTDQRVTEITINGLELAEGPGSMNVSDKHVRYSFSAKKGENKFHLRHSIAFPSLFVPLSEHNSYRKALNKIDAHEKQLVILRKPAPKPVIGKRNYEQFNIVGWKYTLKADAKVAFKKEKLEDASSKLLKEIAQSLKDNPKAQLCIEGHTDNRGKKAKKLALSQQQADAVAAFLVKEGIAKARLRAKGFGGKHPIDPGKSRKARAKNQRIDFVATKAGKSCPR